MIRRLGLNKKLKLGRLVALEYAHEEIFTIVFTNFLHGPARTFENSMQLVHGHIFKFM